MAKLIAFKIVRSRRDGAGTGGPVCLDLDRLGRAGAVAWIAEHGAVVRAAGRPLLVAVGKHEVAPGCFGGHVTAHMERPAGARVRSWHAEADHVLRRRRQNIERELAEGAERERAGRRRRGGGGARADRGLERALPSEGEVAPGRFYVSDALAARYARDAGRPLPDGFDVFLPVWNGDVPCELRRVRFRVGGEPKRGWVWTLRYRPRWNVAPFPDLAARV